MMPANTLRSSVSDDVLVACAALDERVAGHTGHGS